MVRQVRAHARQVDAGPRCRAAQMVGRADPRAHEDRRAAVRARRQYDPARRGSACHRRARRPPPGPPSTTTFPTGASARTVRFGGLRIGGQVGIGRRDTDAVARSSSASARHLPRRVRCGRGPPGSPAPRTPASAAAWISDVSELRIARDRDRSASPCQGLRRTRRPLPHGGTSAGRPRSSSPGYRARPRHRSPPRAAHREPREPRRAAKDPAATEPSARPRRPPRPRSPSPEGSAGPPSIASVGRGWSRHRARLDEDHRPIACGEAARDHAAGRAASDHRDVDRILRDRSSARRRRPSAYDCRAGVGNPIAGEAAATARRRYRREHERHGPVHAPRHGRAPLPRRDDVPRLGAARRGRLRHRHVRRLGRRSRRRSRAMATARAGTWSADVAGRRARRRVPVHDPHRRRRPVADRPVRPPGHELGRQRRSSTTRRPSTGATTSSRCRPGTTSSSTRCTSARSRATARPAGHLRRRPPPAAVPPAAGRLGRPGHAAVRVRRRHLVGLQPGPPVRHRVGLRRAGRVQAVRPRRPRPRHRRHRRRRLQPPRPVRSGPVAVRRLGRGRRRRDLLLQRRARRDAVGRDPARLRSRRGPDVPARQRDDLARGVPLRRPALRLPRSTSGPSTATRPDPAVGAARRLVVPGLDQRRDPRPPAMEDHDRRGPRGRPDRSSTPTADGGAGFEAQWDARVHPPRPAGARGRPTTPHRDIDAGRGRDRRRGPRRTR